MNDMISWYVGRLLDSHLHGNFRVWIVICYFKVFKLEIVNTGHISLDMNFRKFSRYSCTLLIQCFNMVGVDMGIS